MTDFKRRDILKMGLAGMGTLMVPQGLLANFRPRLNDDHFFLQINLQGGADFTYLFDARPLAMTAAGKIHNYIGEEPIAYTGANGGSTWRTRLTDPLMGWKSRFSVVNGVLMSPNFEGHTQNENLFMTGDPFGGASFLPFLNWESVSATPLDGMINGYPFASINNHSSMVPLDPESAGGIRTILQRLPRLSAADELGAHLRARMDANSRGVGRFSMGSRQMLAGFGGMESLHGKLLGLKDADQSDDDGSKFVKLLTQMYRLKVARSALWVLGQNFDTHDSRSAKEQPETFTATVEILAKALSLFENTPFDHTRSMLDVTTVMINSEFGRTMRIENSPIDQTGTNHNPLCNSVVIGGKGIRGGQVIGASDFATATEKLSPAHLALEPKAMSIMARPFDFATGQPRTDLPAGFNVEDYLNIGSVVNTVYRLFNVPTDLYRINSRGGAPAPLIPGLLA